PAAGASHQIAQSVHRCVDPLVIDAAGPGGPALDAPVPDAEEEMDAAALARPLTNSIGTSLARVENGGPRRLGGVAAASQASPQRSVRHLPFELKPVAGRIVAVPRGLGKVAQLPRAVPNDRPLGAEVARIHQRSQLGPR